PTSASMPPSEMAATASSAKPTSSRLRPSPAELGWPPRRSTHPLSLPGLTRQSIVSRELFLRRRMDARVTSALTRVFDALRPRMTWRERSNLRKNALVRHEAIEQAGAAGAAQVGLAAAAVGAARGMRGIPRSRLDGIAQAVAVVMTEHGRTGPVAG